MTLEELKQAIADDLTIDRMQIVDESARTPRLFSKYLSLYQEEKLKLRTIQRKLDKVTLDRREYYLGKSQDKDYRDASWGRNLSEKEIPYFLNADDEYRSYVDKLTFQQIIVDMLERTLKEINNRNYTIRAMIDMIKFESGA